MSLFEDIKEIIGCDNISDMRFEPNLSKAINALCIIKLADYSINELNDFAEYLYNDNQNFKCVYDAEMFFKSKRIE